VAAQFEGDRRLYARLWMRRQKPTLPEPAFAFVMDHSESMRHGGKTQAAFESLVLVREACSRVGIPFTVIMFNNQAELIHDWEQMNDSASEAALSAILKPSGGTSIAAALKAAAASLKQRHERDRYLFLLTDGISPTEEHQNIMKRLTQFAEENITVVPFGIGAEGEAISKLFPEAEIVRNARDFPGALSKTLVRVLSRIGF
jgi:midasin (ATPase involved in ribosome maturation)